MSFLRYIKGHRKGKDANRIEKASLKDPFLFDAIEGYDSIEDNHIERLNKIHKSIGTSEQKNKPFSYTKIVAVIAILIFALGGYLLIDNHKSNLHAQNQSVILDIYVPEQFYNQNKEVIEKQNKVLAQAKTTNPEIIPFSVGDTDGPAVSEAELEILSKQNFAATDPITIYMPDEYMPEKSLKKANTNILSESSSVTLNQNVSNTKQVSTYFQKSNISSGIPNESPQPVIGYTAFYTYLKNNIKHPTDQCTGIKGKVLIEFSIDESGSPILFTIEKSLCISCDLEAIRVIREGPKWSLSNDRVTVEVEF